MRMIKNGEIVEEDVFDTSVIEYPFYHIGKQKITSRNWWFLSNKAFRWKLVGLLDSD